MERQPQKSEFRNNPESFHQKLIIYGKCMFKAGFNCSVKWSFLFTVPFISSKTSVPLDILLILIYGPLALFWFS